MRAIVKAVGVLAVAGSALASSHREAPGIAKMPKVDGADFYMFRSYEPGRGDFITIVADYLPLQDPYGGPNYFPLDENALYQINIDNDGDGRPDITFSFDFGITNRNISLNVGGQMVPVPLVAVGPVSVPGDPNLNIVETYTCFVTREFSHENGHQNHHALITNAATGGAQFLKPVDYIGTKTIPDYPTYAAAHMYTVNLPGSTQQGRLFVGQRKDPFVVNLGEIFDLVNTNPLGPPNGAADSLADKNITSIILEVPISYLTNGTEPVIGGWTTSSIRQVHLFGVGPFHSVSLHGPWQQVSRLGCPLVNEVVIGLKDKDRFNGSEPRDDAQFLTYVTNPTLPALLAALFPVTAPCTPRNDLVEVFLTGIPGLNQPAHVHPAEMLRLNTTTPVTARESQSPLGVLGNDFAGYPNGRRPGDDVVDISLRAVMGVLLPVSCAPTGQLPFTDGAYVDATFTDPTWPYLRTPIPGSPHP
jgi:hypothetical protein